MDCRIKVFKEPREQKVPVGRENVIINKIDKIEGVFPTGTKEITENGKFDVTVDKYVNVEVPTADTIFPGVIESQWSGSVLQQVISYVNLKINNPSVYLTNAFNGYSILTEVKISGLAGNMPNLFYNCRSLTKADLSELTTSTTTFRGEYMFHNCSALKVCYLPPRSAATSLTQRRGMFENCTALETLVMPYEGVSAGSDEMFTNSSVLSGSCSIYVPDVYLEAYQTDSYWSKFTNQLKPISELPEEI